MVITFFDLETTDKEPAQCEIITGHFKTLNLETYEITDQLSITAKPQFWKEESVAIHGITENQAANFGTQSDALRKALLYIKKHSNGLICCHANAFMFGRYGYFDWQVLRLLAFYESDNCYYWFEKELRNVKIISTHTMAKRLISLPNYSLENVAKYFGHEFQAHNAENDVDATIHIFKKLWNGDNWDDLFRLGNGIEYFDSVSDTDWKLKGGLL